MRFPLLSLILAATLAPAAVPAQPAHDHASMQAGAHGMPTEPGQGAFAAIAEIVALLLADPATDWTQVDIDALRQHLLDMEELVSHADVSQTDLPDGAEFRVRLTGPGGGAARRMVPAHAPVLAAETGWASDAVVAEETLIWTVTSPESADTIRALGFFGLMAVGNHHPTHHLAMANGGMAH